MPIELDDARRIHVDRHLRRLRALPDLEDRRAARWLNVLQEDRERRVGRVEHHFMRRRARRHALATAARVLLAPAVAVRVHLHEAVGRAGRRRGLQPAFAQRLLHDLRRRVRHGHQ